MKLYLPKSYQRLLVEGTVQRALEVLLRFPDKEFSLSDLAREAGVAKQHLGLIIDELRQEEIITIEKLSRIWRIRANTHNWAYQRLKIVHNLRYAYFSGLVEFLDERFNLPRAIVLFGSFRMGQDNSASDIDIAIETAAPHEYELVGLKELAPFEKQIGRNIQLHLFHRDSITPEVFASIANGILLLGFLEARP